MQINAELRLNGTHLPKLHFDWQKKRGSQGESWTGEDGTSQSMADSLQLLLLLLMVLWFYAYCVQVWSTSSEICQTQPQMLLPL